MPQEFPTIPYAGPAAARYGDYSKRYMVIHCTSNTAPPSSECAYARRRTDGVGLHFASDPAIVLQGLESWYGTGHVGSAVGNRYGIAWEFTGLISWPTSYWQRCIDRAAPSMRTVMAKWGIPHRWLTAAQMRDGVSRGIVTHKMCSDVWGFSDHIDPGPNFPGQYLIDALNGAHIMTQPFDPYKDETIRTLAQRMDAVRGMVTDYMVNYVDEGDPTKNVQESNELAKYLHMVNAKLDVLLSKADLTEEELQAIENAAREGAEAGAGGATPEQVREVVDSELDEAFGAARDTDT